MGEALITRRSGSSGVKMACGFDGGNGSNTWEETGLGFKPSDIRIHAHDGAIPGSINSIVWKESEGGECYLCGDDVISWTKSEVKVTTTNDGFVIGTPDNYANYVFDNAYYWYAFEEEQELWG